MEGGARHAVECLDTSPSALVVVHRCENIKFNGGTIRVSQVSIRTVTILYTLYGSVGSSCVLPPQSCTCGWQLLIYSKYHFCLWIDCDGLIAILAAYSLYVNSRVVMYVFE